MFSYLSVRKIFFKFDPEKDHKLVEFFAKTSDKYFPSIFSILSNKYCNHEPELIQNILGMKFSNPVGMAAGFDKNATMLRFLTSLGFSHIEYGTLTPKPQVGNDKPRIVRHINEESLQNSMGFNNNGLEIVKNHLINYYPFCIPLGANIGKNKDTKEEDAINDYVALVNGLNQYCDYFAINISSPNTKGLRNLQNEVFVKELFEAITPLTSKPIFLKISPDLQNNEALKICQCAIDNGAKGIIATNTTIDYSLVENPANTGGLSGKVLKDKSFLMFEELAKAFFGKTILVSVGGIDDEIQAYKRIKAGANLVQVYTGFIFKGPSIAKNINQGLLSLLKQDGFSHISEAVGCERK